MAKKTETKSKSKKASATQSDAQASTTQTVIKWMPLERLHLDTENPRFGGRAGNLKDEVAVLDNIVDKFGVEDVLSSIAVNGYIDAEPLVGLQIRDKEDVRIVEGNRRLAACLILAGDPRAKNQAERIQKGQAIRKAANGPTVSKVPVKVYDAAHPSGHLLSYLGVRHLVGSQAWDAYAKAAWIAQVLQEKQLDLDEVVAMIGDSHGTARRMLEGFYFVNQLIDEAKFDPRESTRRGRGSNPEYPFSWVYTGLGYKHVREWLGMKDVADKITKDPVPKAHLNDAGDYLKFMFGKASEEFRPAITDSRQIGNLAESVADPKKRQLLHRGKSVSDVIKLTKAPQDRVMAGLQDAEEALGGVLVTLSEGQLSARKADELVEPSRKVSSMAVRVRKDIAGIATPEGEGEEDD